MPPPLFWASASSSQVSIQTWSVFDPTAAPIGIVPGEFLAGLVPSYSDPNIPRITFPKKPFPEIVDAVGIVPGEFLAGLVSSWLEQFQLSKVRSFNATVAASPADVIFIPPVTARTLIDSQSELKKLKNPAPLDETVQPIFQGPRAPTSGVFTSTTQISINSWSVYDPSTGPVQPPPIPPQQSLVEAPSDIRQLKKPVPFQLTQIVVAIPVDDLWYEAFDVAIRIKGKTFAAWFDPECRSVSVPAPVVQPPQTLWDNTVFSRIKFKGTLTDAVANILPIVFVAPPQVLPDATTFARITVKRFLDETSAPPFVVPTPSIITPPRDGGHGRRDLGPFWKYRSKKQKELCDELLAVEEAVDEIVSGDPPLEDEGVLSNRLYQLDIRAQALLTDIRIAEARSRTDEAKALLAELEARARIVKQQLEEQEEEEAAWLLLHLI